MLRSLTQLGTINRRPPQLPEFMSPPSRETPSNSPSADRRTDSVELARVQPAKKSFARRLGQIGMGLLNLGGILMGAAGGVTAYQHYRLANVEHVCPPKLSETPTFKGDIQEYSDALVRQSLEKAGCDIRDRHEIGRLLQSKDGQVQYDGSKVVLIAFDGTFSYHPRRTPMMQELTRNLQDQGVDTSSKSFDPANIVNRSITNVTGKPTRWSGLGHGVIQDILRDPELNENVQLLSFPSEEIEALSSSRAWKDIMPFELAHEAYRSAVDKPQNIQNAVQAVADIQRQASKRGLSPRYVVMTHSSGGTSAVKFAEKLRATLGKDVQIDFVATIDPVKEAHWAGGEALGELARQRVAQTVNKISTWVGRPTTELGKPAVRSGTQSGTLYATNNVNEWVNFYQTSDILGIKSGPQMGIQGSPVVNAENIRMDDLGDTGHGAIALDDRVSERILQELRERVREPSAPD